MSTTTVCIKFEGHNLTVRGYYEPAEKATFESPGYPEYFQISEIFIGDHPDDITELFSEATVEQIAQAVLEARK